MDRLSPTPMKTKYEFNSSKSTYNQVLTTKNQNSLDLTYAKEFENLKTYARTLQNQQRNLVDQIQRLKVENSHNQNKFVQELMFKDETFHQYKNQKNNQINLLQAQFQEEAHRILRQKDSQYENLSRQYKKNQNLLRQKNQKVIFLENVNVKLNLQLQHKTSQLLKNQDAYNDLNDRFQKLTYSEINLSQAFKRLQAYKNQIQNELRLCIQIQGQKSQALELLQIKLTKSETNERNLITKLQQLSYNFEQLENHSKDVKQKLNTKQNQNADLKNNIDKLNHQIIIKDRENSNLGQINIKLTKQIQEAMRVQQIRQSEILGLIAQNERLYNQVNMIRHKLHDLAIKYNFTL